MTPALERRPRAVAVGEFDGVHAGHRQTIAGLVATGLQPTVVTVQPHLLPRDDTTHRLLATVERRLELLEETGVSDVLLLETQTELDALRSPDRLAALLLDLGVEVILPPGDPGDEQLVDLAALEARGLVAQARPPGAPVVSSAEIRQLVRAGDVVAAAALLARPAEVEGTVVAGRGRAGALGFPSANLAVAPDLVEPPGGVYAGWARGHRAGISIGVDDSHPDARGRIEAHLLGFDGDLYGQRLVLELWSRIRGERFAGSDRARLDQAALDVEAARVAERPA